MYPIYETKILFKLYRMTFISESLLTKQTGGVRVIVSKLYPISGVQRKSETKRNAEREKEKKKGRRNMRRRRFVALGLAAIMAMTVTCTGCGGSSSAKTDSTTGGEKNRQKQPAEKKRLHFELAPDIRNPIHGSRRWKIIL
ncbi:MAG: hypothetical protein ACLR8P_18325 [Clostridium fessum]